MHERVNYAEMRYVSLNLRYILCVSDVPHCSMIMSLIKTESFDPVASDFKLWNVF